MKRLLVALDDSPRAYQVLGAALNLARCYEGELVVLRATATKDLPFEANFDAPEDLEPVLEHRALEDLHRLVKGLTHVSRVRAEEGPPEDVIHRVAKEEEVDAIVIGAHGYTLLERALGTVAARVVDRAHCPVFVVRNPI